MSEELVLKAVDIKKSFKFPKDIPILCGVNLEVARGRSIAIMGRSGQGKSTLLQILGTLDDPTSGHLEINGQKVSMVNKSTLRNQHIGFIFQSFHLLDDYRAIDNVLMPAYIARQPIHPKSESYRKAQELLEFVGLKERMFHYTKLLSGGEKQRIAIARSLCNNPSLILADEPSGNLDGQTANAIHSLLLNYIKEYKKSLVVVTHDPHLASLCDETLILEGGVLIPKEELTAVKNT